MAEKVKLPQNVAEAIETLRNADYTDYGIVVEVEKGTVMFNLHPNLLKVIRDWTFDDNGANSDRLLDALRIGYDIEQPPIKAGVWVARTRTRRVKRYQTDLQDVVFKVMVSDGQTVRGEDGNTHSVQGLRHATAEEKVWAEIGRRVNEFRVGDAYKYANGNWGVALSEGIVKAAKRFYDEGHIVGLLPTESYVDFSEIVSFGDGDDE